MEGVDNFAGCLKILQNQGFEAEHRLLVQLFGCIETYWNTSVVESLYIPRDIPSISLDDGIENVAKKSLVEEGEIVLSEDDLLLEENVIEVKSEKVSTKKKETTEQVEQGPAPILKKV